MNFEDEPYVRKYTRKTVTSRLLGWQGRAVLDAMLGEFDAAGIFAIRGDAAQCISAVTDIPIEIVRAGLGLLIETETWVVTARSITWLTFEEAQNCRRSDRLRQRESRRARSAQSVTDVTIGHSSSRLSQPVTAGHDLSPSLPLLPPSAPLLPPSHPPKSEDPDARAPVEIPGLEIVYPLPPSKRDQELDAQAYALTTRGQLRHRFSPEFIQGGPTKANQAEGHMLGLTDEEIWARFDLNKNKYFPSPFDDDEAQFSRELAFAKADKEKHQFKSRAEREAFEMPGRERRA